MLELAHEGSGHAGTRRAYNRIHDLAFIPRLRDKLKTYIGSCPACQRSKPSRLKPYGELQPVRSPTHPFEVVNIDFVTALPTVDGYDSLATVTCQYTKFIQILPGREDWPAESWAKAFFDRVVRHHSLLKAIISDRDPKFTGTFWQHLLQKCRVKSYITTAYHPAADGQAERTNQSVEIALRCMLVGDYEEHWLKSIPEIERILNTLFNTSIGMSPFEALYGYSPNYQLNHSSNSVEAQEFMENCKMI